MSDDDQSPDSDEVTHRRGERPGGLLGWMLWPLEALLLGGIRLALGFMAGVVRAMVQGFVPGVAKVEDRDAGRDEESEN